MSRTHVARSNATTAGMPDACAQARCEQCQKADEDRRHRANTKGRAKAKAKAKGRIKGRAMHAHLKMRHI